MEIKINGDILYSWIPERFYLSKDIKFSPD